MRESVTVTCTGRKTSGTVVFGRAAPRVVPSAPGTTSAAASTATPKTHNRIDARCLPTIAG